MVRLEKRRSSYRRLRDYVALLCLITGWSGSIMAQSSTGGDPSQLTGSPSMGTSSISPTTVAAAVSRLDDEDRFGLSIGTSVAGGKFGGRAGSSIWSTAVGLRYSTGGLRLSASLPYMRIRSAATIISGIDSTLVVIFPAGTGARTTHNGVGDLTLGASYVLPKPPNGLEVELSGRVKFSTASGASSLSSGRSDYSVGAQVTKQTGRFAPFASFTYRIFGDPRSLKIKDGLAASAGSSIVFGDKFVALASYHYARAASQFVKDSHEIFAGASYLLPQSRLRLTAFATGGLSSGAAAASGGISVSVDFQ